MTNRNACVLLDAAKVADLKAFAAALTKLDPWQLAMVAGSPLRRLRQRWRPAKKKRPNNGPQKEKECECSGDIGTDTTPVPDSF